MRVRRRVRTAAGLDPVGIATIGAEPVRRILFAAAHCYLDDANGAAVASRAMMEALARRGFAVEVLTGARLEIGAEIDFEAHLLTRGLSAQPLGGDSWSIDANGLRPETPSHYRFVYGGVPVTLHRGAFPRSRDDESERRGFLRLLSAKLEQFRPHVVVNYGGDALAEELRRMARASGARVVFALHNFAYSDPRPFTTADAVIVPSRFAADHYRSALGLECTVLPNLMPFDRVLAPRRDPRYVTFVNPSYEKGVYVFARIADELGRRRPDIPLLVVEGRGSERTLADCGLDLTTYGNVFLMGHTPDPRQFWGVTRLCVVPSLWKESQCLVAVEAMINGIPVLSGDRGALPETLGGAGVLLPLPEWLTPAARRLPTPEEVAPWVEAIIRVWDDPGRYDELCRRSTAGARRWEPAVMEPLHVDFFARMGDSASPAGSAGG